jgi:lipoprotein-anchoring transpeptidase ErfK/SrfK
LSTARDPREDPLVRRLVSFGLVLAGCAHAGAPAKESSPPRPLRVAANALSAPAPAKATKPTAKTPEDITRELDRFFSEGYPPKIPSSTHGRIASLSWGTWIQPTPNSGALPLGGIRPGSSLPLLAKELTRGQGRCSGFAQVELGFVCVGPRSTLDLDARFIRESVWTAPAPGILPYHYAMSTGAPQLAKPVKLEGAPWKIGSRQVPKMRGWNAGHDELAEDPPIRANGPIPDFLRDGGQVPTPWGEPRGVFFKMAPKGTMIAYTRAFEAFGETWVLTSDMRVMPARGLKHFRVSTYQGVELGNDVQLPIAFMRKRAQPKWKKNGDNFEATPSTWPLRTWVGLTGVEVKDGKRTFLETKEPGVYIERPDATVVETRPKAPWEAHGTDKWIHIRVNRGTLTLYEGTKPVFTTLMSPGKKDSTPYGRYFLESKHWFAAMSGESGEPTSFWIDAVPWTQYFDRPYAIHAAFWHEDFGERKSGGCVNLSPIDAKRVFEFTTPVLPKDWDTVGAIGPNSSTFVLVEA